MRNGKGPLNFAKGNSLETLKGQHDVNHQVLTDPRSKTVGRAKWEGVVKKRSLFFMAFTMTGRLAMGQRMKEQGEEKTKYFFSVYLSVYRKAYGV